MAGFFQNLRLVSERSTLDDMGVPASNAYETSITTSDIPQPDAEQTTSEATQSNILTIQPIPQGFGAYLDGILPPDNAKAAGAFSVAMQQIKNISSIPVEKFAQVVNSLETTKGLNVNGSSVPTDTSLASQGLSLIALGNGPYGTYTMSNFLGCMSGLPYLGINIRQLIQQLETPTLYERYKNLYLAVTWAAAQVTVEYDTDVIESPPSVFTTYYTVTGVTVNNGGGGYGINGALAPTITITNGGGASAVAIIGTTYTDIGFNGSGNYGRVIDVTFTPGSATTSVPSVTIQTPPITYGNTTNQPSGTTGWPGMNTAVQLYIDAANAEIVNIKNAQPARAQQLITNWENTGRILSIEQRAIATGMALQVPLADPRDSPIGNREPTLAGYPTTQYAFIDSIPRYAKFTQPHMYSQTLEAISNLNTVGGRSIVGMLREARNQARLQEIGVPLDNNIENKLTKPQEAQLIGNGGLPNSVPAANGLIPYPTPSPSTNIDGAFVSTVPATLAVVLPGVTLSTPVPYPASLESGTVSPDTYGYYDPTTDNYFTTNRAYQGNGITADTLSSAVGSGGSGDGGSGNGVLSGIGSVVDTGKAVEPGSFAGSRYSNLIPPELSVIYTSDILLPATYSVPEAIDEVIRCNCDCWDNI